MQTESPWTDADAGMRSRPASPSVLSDGILGFRAAQVCTPTFPTAHHPLPTLPVAHTARTAHCVPTCPQVLSCFAKGRVPSDMAAAPQPCLNRVDCAANHMHGLSANPEMVTVLGGDDNEGEEEEYHQHEMGLQPKLAQNPPLSPPALKTWVPHEACNKVPWTQQDNDLLLQVRSPPHPRNPHPTLTHLASCHTHTLPRHIELPCHPKPHATHSLWRSWGLGAGPRSPRSCRGRALASRLATGGTTSSAHRCARRGGLRKRRLSSCSWCVPPVPSPPQPYLPRAPAPSAPSLHILYTL